MRDNLTIRTLRTVAAFLPAAILAPIAGCSNGSNGGGLPPDVKAIVFLQRTPRGRLLTALAFQHLGLPEPARDPSQFGLFSGEEE